MSMFDRPHITENSVVTCTVFNILPLVLPREAMLSQCMIIAMCLCVCVSATRRSSIKTAKQIIAQTTSHGIPEV